MAQSNVVTRIPSILSPPPTSAQLAILLVDGSGSMTEETAPGSGQSKADAVVQAAQGMAEEFRKSRIKDSFWISAVSFNTDTAGMMPVDDEYVKAADLEPSLIQYQAGFLTKERRTNIALALERAMEIGRHFEEDQSISVRARKIVVVLLSDGKNNEGSDEDLVGIAREVSNMWGLCTVAFGHDAAERMLRDIAIEDKYFFQTADPKRLRAIFIHSSTLAKQRTT